MKLQVKIKKGLVEIFIKEGAKTVAETVFKEESNISEKLLPEIDEMLKENNLSTNNIEKVEINSEIPDSWTTSRIAKTVEKGFNLALKNL